MTSNISSFLSIVNECLAEIEKTVIGKADVVKMAFITFLAGGHVLFEDFPGLGKTLIARSLATVLGLDFKRIQFTPDLLPSDIIGGSVFLRDKGEFILRKGPVFTNVLLADEINRASPKTQSALLEAMQEARVTIEGETHPLDASFFVMATQNPIENEGTFPLPEAQLDRFMMRLSVGYMSGADEIRFLKNRLISKTDDIKLRSIANIEVIASLKQEVKKVYVHDDILNYIVNLITATRTHECVEVGASPRASLGLVKLAQARAFMLGREFVIPDDIKSIFSGAINHRIFLKPEYWIEKNKKQDIIDVILRTVKVPLLDRQ